MTNLSNAGELREQLPELDDRVLKAMGCEAEATTPEQLSAVLDARMDD